jgi:hypothetical protein
MAKHNVLANMILASKIDNNIALVLIWPLYHSNVCTLYSVFNNLGAFYNHKLK